MADHADQSAGTSENRSLDQSAIDEAIAAMQAGDPEPGQAAAQGTSDQASRGDAGDTNAPAEILQTPVHSNAGETFGEVQSDGQEDLDAAIAAIQADVVEEAAAFHSGDDDDAGIGQENADTATTDRPPGVTEEIEAATDESAAQLAAVGHPSDADMDTDANRPPDDPDDVTDTERQPSITEAGRMSPDEGAEPPVTEPDAPAEAESIESENTFSDLDESDLEDAEPDQATTEAVQLAAMTASFDDEKASVAPDEEDLALAATIAADSSAGAGTTPSENSGSANDPEAATADGNTAKRPAPKASSGAFEKTGRQKKIRGILLTAVIIAFGVVALYGRDFYSVYRERMRTPAPPPVPETVSNRPVSTAPVAVSKPQDPYQEKLQEVGRLRADLLAKKKEIDQLKQFYRDGISELEEELQQEATRLQINTFAEAAANHKIELDLRSIQRRWAYIDELEKPSSWLYQGSEELLFLSRRAQIDLQMSTIASGIEMTRHTRHLNASLQKYQLSPDRLAIDLTGSRLRPLEDIWNAIGEQNKTIAKQAVTNGDQAIIAEICEGYTGRIAELKTLTIRASKCLSQIESLELFLNQLTSISPVAAKYLSQWHGQWLCLNGFRQLSPDVARHLFRWNGGWISLNGLKEFPPEIGEMLISWQGRQLELMGLVHDPEKMERIGYQQLADWEKSGGKLFVPERIRSEIEKLDDNQQTRYGRH